MRTIHVIVRVAFYFRFPYDPTVPHRTVEQKQEEEKEINRRGKERGTRTRREALLIFIQSIKQQK